MRQLNKNEPIPYNLLLLADEEMQAIERYILQSDIYVVDMGGEVIGVCVLYALDKHTIEIKAIAVDSKFQNQGIGKSMLKDAELLARNSGYHDLVIGTPTNARKQLSIYQKSGFIEFDIRKDFFIQNYAKPIFEDGVQLKDMAVLKKILS